jgi:predicted TIM-barrel fold metal-dependent hydrolase
MMAPVTALAYRAFDGDNHYYETRDAFTRFAEPRFRERVPRVERGANGEERVWIDGRPFTFLSELNYTRTVRPGSLREMLRTLSSDHVLDSSVAEDVRPEYLERGGRLGAMDAQGLESCLQFPTLGVCIEHFLTHDVELCYASLGAFNRWLEDQWGFGRDGRIFAVPLLSLLDRERAVAELERVLAAGARMIHLRAGPAFGRSPADPWFDPFWARVNEAGLAVSFHIGESSYNQLYSTSWGEQPEPSAYDQSAFQWCMFYGDRPIMDTVAALILHNLFGRFPRVRVYSVENGSLWVPYLLKQLDKMKGMGRNGPWLGGVVRGRPSEIFRQHVLVSPYHEEDVVALAKLIGPSQVVFGSDWPHAEGLEHPLEFAEALAGLPEDEVRAIMRGNARRLVGLDA